MVQPVKQGPSIMTPIIVGVILALLVGSASPWWWDKIFAPDDDAKEEVVDSQGSTERPSNDGETQSNEAADGGSDADNEEGSESQNTTSACEIAIENPLVTLYEDTDAFGLEAGRAPPGRYAVTAIETVTFAGNPQRWFRITTDGVTGWVQDNSILIASKSGDCQ